MSDLDGTRAWVRKAPVWLVISVVWLVGFPLCFASYVRLAFNRSIEDVCSDASAIRRARSKLRESKDV